jgi:type II secretory pathway pseudopilin PulG
MAARENQGLQALVIALTIFVLLLGVGLLLVNNARKTAVARATEAENRANTANQTAAKAQSEAGTYKQWIGFGENDAFEATQEQYKKDMETYGVNMDEEGRKYATLLGNIFEENRKLVQNEANAKQQIKDLTARVAAIEAEKEAQVKKFEEQMKTAASDAAKARTDFEEQYATMKSEKEKLAAELATKQKSYDEDIVKLENDRKALETSIIKLENSIDKFQARLPEADPFAQPADGEITWVDQANRTVWINLGAADGLRPQVTFSIAAEGLDDAQAAEKKGSIEVTRVDAAHTAEARITSDEDTNPLMPGDRIYSLVWDRGRQVGFGIAGIIDMDGDGKEDLELLKSVIAANNGRVDAAPDKTGKQQGEIQVDTRYLILGEFPSDRNQEFRATWDALSQEAESLGVETIPLQEFLPLIGWHADARSVRMGAAARAQDFPARPPGESLPRKPVQPTGAFKPRQAGTAY